MQLFDTRLLMIFFRRLDSLEKEDPILMQHVMECFLPLIYSLDIPKDAAESYLGWYKQYLMDFSNKFAKRRVGRV